MASPQYQYILYEVKNKLAKITLNRPRKKNAIKLDMMAEITDALNQASKDDNVVVCLLTGAGDFYCSGNDLTNFQDQQDRGGSMEENLKYGSDLLESFVRAFIDFPKQLIAAVNGPAVGIAVTTLGLVDVVYASDKATFNTPFTTLGQCAEGCSSYTFSKIMGPSLASEVLYFGRKLTAQDAKRCGLVADVFPAGSFRDEVDRRVNEYAKLPPKTLMAAKKLCRDVDRARLHQAVTSELKTLNVLWVSEECMQGVMNFLMRKSKL
ncbi:putative enoyl-CoA delta isomerase 2, mitochondrial [Apostichopus japonicus]|uniref:Putative enoyl-CoA delta isomerase 2, mitochondrial n=1 Tax=Stichopus japonicus TaxID=307972 RepID=A0A2G8LHX9_STIJA|nr:putative enoyl-CoA delta isomerase 2, mitochondrial [Apostichopus japonicus]